jgi:hypothetical protein
MSSSVNTNEVSESKGMKLEEAKVIAEIPALEQKKAIVSKINFAHDTIVGIELLPNEKILRITPCKIKAFTQVKECVLYITSQRLVCTRNAGSVADTFAKMARRPTDNVEALLNLKSIVRADVLQGKIKIVYVTEGNKTKSDEYVIGLIPLDLGEFIMKARQGSISITDSPIVDDYQDLEAIKSTLGRGLSLTGKALYTGTKLSIEKYQQLNKIAKDSEKIFADAAKEEDKVGWSSFRGEKGREAEKRVARLLESLGYTTYLNVHLQEREIDIVAQKGSCKIMIECKFGKRP